MPPNYTRMLFSITDDELEQFVNDWLSSTASSYPGGHERFSGPGDMGRDVVGYLTAKKMDGDWHNFQCKQFRTVLNKGSFLIDLAKLFFYSARGHFSLPQKTFFVAPRGVSRTVKSYTSKPLEMRQALLSDWDTTCANKIQKGVSHKLTPAIQVAIENYDFSNVEALDADALVTRQSIKAVLVKWFGEDPGPYPAASVPADIQSTEETYIEHLVAAYEERRGAPFVSAVDALSDQQHGPHLRDQRTRYFEADAFMRHYRDNTPTGVLADFRSDIYHGVIDEHRSSTHADALDRVNNVMKHAAAISVTGILARYAKITVKQGTCHHLVNTGELSWKP